MVRLLEFLPLRHQSKLTAFLLASMRFPGFVKSI
jgi:hypothetical protein